MSLREEQRALTRRRILDATLDLVTVLEPQELSIPAVAQRSGVSIATIYRYFPTKDALIDAAALVPSQRAQPHRPERLFSDELPAYLRELWGDFAKNMTLARRQVASPIGREMRDKRLQAGRAQLAGELASLGLDPDTPASRRLVSLSLLLGGSVALLELHDRQGLDVDDAVEVVSWAAGALLAATLAEARLDPNATQQRGAP